MNCSIARNLTVVACSLACAAGCGKANGESLDVGSDDSGATAEPDASVTIDGGGTDHGAGVFTTTDAGAGPSDGGGLCDLGSAGNVGSAANPNLFGTIVYYEDGGPLPAGRYRATYVGGCMEYDFLEGWAVQAPSPSGFWFVGDTSDNRIVQPPGLTTSNPAFAGCVTANLAVAPAEFEFDGGKIGVWLNDNPYVDNVEGPDGGNPKWSLQLLETCPPNLAPK
jgi:hypothetical protein